MSQDLLTYWYEAYAVSIPADGPVLLCAHRYYS